MRIAIGIIALLFATLILYAELIITQRDLIDLLRNAWTSFLTLGLISLLLEVQFRTKDRQEKKDIYEKIDNIPQNVAEGLAKITKLPEATLALLEQSFVHRIGTQNLARGLVRYLSRIGSDPRLICSADIEVRLLGAIGTQAGFRLQTTQKLLLELGDKDLIVAIVKKNEHIDKVANYNPEIDLVLCPSDCSEEMSIDEKLKNFRVTAKTFSPHSGVYKLAQASISVVSPGRLKKIQASSRLTDIETKEITFIQFSVACQADESAEFTVTSTFEMLEDDDYAFWSADRVMYVRRLEFHYGELRHRIKSVSTQLFMLSPDVVVERSENENMRGFQLNGWVLPGQGVLIKWKWA